MEHKGIVFIGCSFTYGYALNYYYPNYIGDFKNPYPEVLGNVPQPDYLYQKQIRFTNKVANHFDTWHLQPNRISGGDYDNIDYLNDLFNKDYHEPLSIDFKKIDIEKDIKCVIFQTSYIDRCFEIAYDRVKRKSDGKLFSTHDELTGYLERWRFFDSTHNNLYQNFIYNQVFEIVWNDIKTCVQRFEEVGVSVYFLHMQDFWKNIKDEYLKSRHIPIEFRNKEYYCFNDIPEDGLIAFDFDYFGDLPPRDYHPNRELHNAVSKSIIKTIQHEFE